MSSIYPVNPSEQRRDVGVTCFSQVGAHLELRMDTTVDPANHLEHEAFTDHHGAVRLLGAEVAHWTLRIQAQRGQLIAVFEANFTGLGGQTHALLAGIEHAPYEVFLDESIRDQAYLAPATDAGHCQLLMQRAVDLLLGQQPERQLIVRNGVAAAHLELAEQYRTGGAAEAHAVSQAHCIDCRLLTREPAALGQVLRQDGVFQCLARRRFQQLLHALAQYQRGQLGHALGRLDVPGRHAVVGRQHEPVERVGRQGQQERQLADGRERATAQHLHRYTVGVLRQLQFGCLGRT